MENNRPEIESDEHPDPPSPDQPRKLINPFWVLTPIIVFIILVSVIFGFIYTPASDKRRLEINVRNKLRELGSSQLAYQGTNNMKYYGSFQALQDTGYIESGFGLDNYVESYELTWHMTKCMPPFGSMGMGLCDGTFTIVAYPSITPPPALRTFGISEDQVLRVFNPDNGNPFISRDDPHVQSWDPIL
jgi:hypothetical protein